MPVSVKPNKQAMRLITEQLENRMHRAGKRVERVAKMSMRDGGTPHVRSNPGEPPRVETGNLKESVTTETERSDRMVETRIGTNVIYGLFLELGTSKMAPRPWLRPAFDKVTK